MRIKLNTDTILANQQGVESDSPALDKQNYTNKLKALVYFHRKEYLTFLEVESVPIDDAASGEGEVFSQEFNCNFSVEEYEIVNEPIVV